jgi:uncharacterized protein YjbI with pentapeptide repeats
VLFNSCKVISGFEKAAFWLYPSNNDRNGELFKIGLSVLGAVGILFGLYVSLRRAIAMEKGVLRQKEAIEIQGQQIILSRKAQTDERFKNAVEHLGNEKEPIILGGVAELNQIANENINDYAEIVFNILCSYIRSNANIYEKIADEINTTVIQTIIDNLFKSNNGKQYIYKDFKANLSGTNLSSLDLDNSFLIGANLSFCYMPGLKNTDLSNSDLSKSVFTLSDINKVNFKGANLFETLFYASTIANSNMNKDTELLSTVFLDSELSKVNFSESSFSDCKFISCDIISCNFEYAEIISSSFVGSGLFDLDFSLVKLFASNDFRAAGFNNVVLYTIITRSKFDGCRIGKSYRYYLEKNLKDDIGLKADLGGAKIDFSSFMNCSTDKLSKQDIDDIIGLYNKCKNMDTIKNSKTKKKEN